MNKSILGSLRQVLLERARLDKLPDDVWKRSAALNTWGTNAIEGSTITRGEAERILLEGKSVPGRPMRDVLETVSHERAFRGLIGRLGGEVTLETALELHLEVFRGILHDAGQWRRVNVRIRGAGFTPPRMEKVVGEMDAWRGDYRQRDVEGEDVFELAARMHYGFESVHPFSDGNGRVGRLLLNLHFLRRNWPPVHILPADRVEYLTALNSADGGDLAPLAALFRRLMGARLVDLLDQVGTGKDELKPLKKLAPATSHSEKYLALRCGQGVLPAVKAGKAWHTSVRAIGLYREHVGRGK
jgi:Fic family protein